MRFTVASIALFLLLQRLDAAPTLAIRQDESTRNDLTDDNACKPYTLIFARGTVEPAGNLGSVGTPFAAALEAKLGDECAVQGVNYEASQQGAFNGGDAAGSTEMYKLVADVAKACPSSKIILAGYSQGAQLVHNAVAKMTQAQAKKVRAIVTFGDPKKAEAYGKGLAAKAKTYCHAGDTICSTPMPDIKSCRPQDYACMIRVGQQAAALQKMYSSGKLPASHTTYPSDCKAAATFVKKTIGQLTV